MNFYIISNKYNTYLKYTLIYLIAVHIHIIRAQEEEIIADITSSSQSSSSDVICSQASNCSKCISHPQCAWCMSVVKTLPGISRCDSSDSLLANGCPDADIVNPASSVEIVKVLDYPIDLYYLMDLTYSMKEHKEKLVELADSLAVHMNNITKSFRLGFGSFIDKVVMPYASMVSAKLANPCTDQQACAPPYGFRNHLPLSHNISRFAVEVGSTPLSGNLDNAEG
ncbi:unnamed protein product, partial [Medioppia subpectinata]